MPLGKQDGLRLLQAGQSIVLQTSSPIYRGPYGSHVISTDDAGVRITIPIEQGKLILLPVGASVVVSTDTPSGHQEYASRVLERRSGNDRCLLLEAPAQHKEEIRERQVPVWTVTSGKGGVGKTTIVSNLAIALAEQGRRVCLIDGDLGTANVDVMLNLPPKYTLTDVIKGN
jgi:flagellar biosynthesis protein FlhG